MSSLNIIINNTLKNIPEFCLSHWLLRIPLAVIFIQQGLMKLPLDPSEAESYGLSYLTWWVVAHGELGAGLGLIFGGILNIKSFQSLQLFCVILISSIGLVSLSLDIIKKKKINIEPKTKVIKKRLLIALTTLGCSIFSIESIFGLLD